MMNQGLISIRAELEQNLAEALLRRVMSNRGTLLPFRLPAIAQAIVAALLDDGADAEAAGRALGQSLNQQGLGFPSLLEAQTSILQTVMRAYAGDMQTLIETVNRFFNLVIQGFTESLEAERDHQHNEMERALLNAIAQQREQEQQFHHTLSELSTPIIPVHEGILILPLVGSISSRRATEITERLLEAISENQAEIVIIDITGVPAIDTSIANDLLRTTRAANLLGSRIVLVGLSAEIAQTIVRLGVDLQGLVTLANLQSGIAYALKSIGLGIQPIA